MIFLARYFTLTTLLILILAIIQSFWLNCTSLISFVWVSPGIQVSFTYQTQTVHIPWEWTTALDVPFITVISKYLHIDLFGSQSTSIRMAFGYFSTNIMITVFVWMFSFANLIFTMRLTIQLHARATMRKWGDWFKLKEPLLAIENRVEAIEIDLFHAWMWKSMTSNWQR